MTTTTASSELQGSSKLQGSSELQQAWTDWHRDRETELSAEHCWLSLTGFDWLPTEPSALDGLPGRWYSAGDGPSLAPTPPTVWCLRAGTHRRADRRHHHRVGC